MLTITPQAADAIREVLASQSAPEGSIFRISPQPGQSDLVVSIVDAPRPDDQIVQGNEVEICVERSAAEILDDKELNATIVGSEVHFSIGEQTGPGGEPPSDEFPDPDGEGPRPPD